MKDQCTIVQVDNAEVELVRGMLNAWAKCDADAVMTFVAEDAVFCMSTGPEPGLTLSGVNEISPVINSSLSDARGAVLSVTNLMAISGGGVIGTWTLVGINAKGQNLNVKGIGIIRVSGNKVIFLDGYRKTAS